MGICRCLVALGANVPRNGHGRFYLRSIVREYVWERRSWQQSLLRFRVYLGHLLDHHLAQLEV